MRFLAYIFVFTMVIPSNLLLANNSGKGFLITLSGAKLTGNITSIAFEKGKTQVSFENDFGDVYILHPATIYGFAVEEKGEISFYESKKLGGEWRFLLVEEKGERLSLYTSAERQLQFTNPNESPILVEEKNPQMWLQFSGEEPFKIYRFTYRGILKKKMKAYPELVQSIGKRGFRYKNLPMIVDLYNKLCSKNQ